MFRFDTKAAIRRVKAANSANHANSELKLAGLATLAGDDTDTANPSSSAGETTSAPQWTDLGITAVHPGSGKQVELVRHATGRICLRRRDGVLLSVNQAEAQRWLQ